MCCGHVLQAQYHYQLQPQLLGHDNLRTLLERCADTCIVRSGSQGRLLLHPSPVLHLRSLLRQLLGGPSGNAGGEGAQGAYPTTPTAAAAGGGGGMCLGMPGPNGNNGAAGHHSQPSAMFVSDQFAVRYGYVMPVRQLGFKMLPEVLALLPAACTLVGTGSNAKLMPPAPGARNTFNEVSGAMPSINSTCQLCVCASCDVPVAVLQHVRCRVSLQWHAYPALAVCRMIIASPHMLCPMGHCNTSHNPLFPAVMLLQAYALKLQQQPDMQTLGAGWQPVAAAAMSEQLHPRFQKQQGGPMMHRPGQGPYQQQQQQHQGNHGGAAPPVAASSYPTVPSNSVPPQQVMLQVKQMLVLKLADLPQAVGE